MQAQNTLIVHPTSSEQLAVVKAFLKALKIKFEVASIEKPYDPEFVVKIEQSRQDYKNGLGTVVTLEELSSLCK